MMLAALLACRAPEPPPPPPDPPPPSTATVPLLSPGRRVLALAEQPGAPIEAILFFAPDSPVLPFARAYFEGLAAHSGGRITVRVEDQALVPALAEELDVDENGTVALRGPDRSGRIRLAGSPGSVAYALRELDTNVGPLLVDLSRKHGVTWTGGHGEAVADDPRRARGLDRLWRDLVRGEPKPRPIPTATAPLATIPVDTQLVVVAGPERPWTPDEEQVLTTWLDAGGRTLILLPAGGASLPGVLAHIGLTTSGARVGGATTVESGPLAGMLTLPRPGAHPAAKALPSFVNARTPVVALDALQVLPGPPPPGVTLKPLLPCPSDDACGVVWGASGPAEHPWRAVVSGSADVFGDLLQQAPGNAALSRATLDWLREPPELPGAGDDPPAPVVVPPEPAGIPLVAADPVDHIRWTSAGENVTIERRSDDAGSFLWGTETHGKTVKQFLVREDQLPVPLLARREVPVTTVPDPTIFGLDTPEAELEIVAGGKTTRLHVGAETWRGAERFVGSADTVYVIAAAELRALSHAGTQLSDARLLPRKGEDLDHARLTRGTTTLDVARMGRHWHTDGQIQVGLDGPLTQLMAANVQGCTTTPPSTKTELTLTFDGAWIEVLSAPRAHWYVRSSWTRGTCALPAPVATALVQAVTSTP